MEIQPNIKNNTNNILFLSIGGFSIRLIFDEVEFEHRRIFLINLIKQRYVGFLIQQIKKFDFTIHFTISEVVKSLNTRSHQSLFINLYDVENETTFKTFYHISLFQLDLILTHILQRLLSKNGGFFIHTSSVLINNHASLFLGKSGDGKSTASQLLKNDYPVIADDGVILRKQNNKWFVYQTHYLEKNEILKKTGQKYLLGNLFFLKKDKKFKLVKIVDETQIVPLLIGQFYTQEIDVNSQYIELVSLVNNHKQFYFLHFKKERNGLFSIISNI